MDIYILKCFVGGTPGDSTVNIHKTYKKAKKDFISYFDIENDIIDELANANRFVSRNYEYDRDYDKNAKLPDLKLVTKDIIDNLYLYIDSGDFWYELSVEKMII